MPPNGGHGPPAAPRDPTALLRWLGSPPGPVLAALRLRGTATTRELAADPDVAVTVVRGWKSDERGFLIGHLTRRV